MTPSPNQSQLQTTLRSFLLSVLPSGVEVIEGQDNRVPEPSGTDFVVMTTIQRRRLETNIEIYADVAFTASISGVTMTVSAVQFGIIQTGSILWGSGVASGTQIAGLGTGSGGVGTYFLSIGQTIASEQMAAGNVVVTQPTEVTVQLDFHSANVDDAADMAETVSTLFRDEIAVDAFAVSSPYVYPLFADDPHQVPFLNAEQQYETRWVLDAHIQANQAIDWPMQFMGVTPTINIISIS
jgi:hypothetical protein